MRYSKWHNILTAENEVICKWPRAIYALSDKSQCIESICITHKARKIHLQQYCIYWNIPLLIKHFLTRLFIFVYIRELTIRLETKIVRSEKFRFVRNFVYFTPGIVNTFRSWKMWSPSKSSDLGTERIQLR